MVTMKQIDEAREDLGRRRASSPNFVVASAERRVEALLRQWWAQGCRETPVASLLADQRDEARENAARWKVRAEKAEAAMQSAIDRARGACAFPPTATSSEGNDWIDELIGLLAVTRGQRDAAQRERDDAESRGNTIADNFGRSSNESKAQIDKLCAEVTALQHAIRDALERLQSPGVAYGQAIEILSTAIRDSDPRVAAPRAGSEPRPPLGAAGFRMGQDPTYDKPIKPVEPPVTHEWVETEIVRQFREEILPRVEAKINEKIDREIQNHRTEPFPHFR